MGGQRLRRSSQRSLDSLALLRADATVGTTTESRQAESIDLRELGAAAAQTWRNEKTTCAHSTARSAARLSHGVLVSCRAENEASHHHVVWRPGLGLKTCCLDDVRRHKWF
jgi:hypothetical protein